MSKVITFHDYCSNFYRKNSNRLQQLNQCASFFCLHYLHITEDTSEQCFTSLNHSHLLHLYWKIIKNLHISYNCVFTVIIKTIHSAWYSIYITWPHPTSNLSHHPISCEVCSFTNHNYTCTSFLSSSIKHHLTLGTHRTVNTILFTPYIQHVTLHPFIFWRYG